MVAVREYIRFQSTPPHGRRPDGKAAFELKPRFNPRLRTGGDWKVSRRSRQVLCSFNPRLRTGGDPARGVESRGQKVSIHASAREATFYRQTSAGTAPCFNPRLRTGGDNNWDQIGITYRVSIHASAREATKYANRSYQAMHVSIHASAREATQWNPAS